LQIEPLRNSLLTEPFTEGGEDPSDDRSLRFVDNESIANGIRLSRMIISANLVHGLGSVSIYAAARRVPIQKSPVESPLRSFPEIVEIEFVDQTLDGDTDLHCVISGIDAIGYSYHPHTDKTQPLDDNVGIAYVAR